MKAKENQQTMAAQNGPPIAAGPTNGLRQMVAAMPLSTRFVFGAFLFIVLGTIVLGVLIPQRAAIRPAGEPLIPPNASHLLGTDEIGRDILTRVLFGMRASWWGAVIVVASGVLIGATVGLIAGTAGGIIDTVLMRLTDAFLALPGPVLAIAVVSALGPSYSHTIIAVSIVWWPWYSRIVRGEVHRVRASPHVEAARAAGTGRVRLATRYLLPGAVPATVVAASLDVGAVILTLASLSFLGLGQPAPAPELGSMTTRGIRYLLDYWWVPIMPAMAVFLLALIANAAGDALRDRMRER